MLTFQFVGAAFDRLMEFSGAAANTPNTYFEDLEKLGVLNLVGKLGG